MFLPDILYNTSKVFDLSHANENVWDEELIHSFVDNDDVEGVLNPSMFAYRLVVDKLIDPSNLDVQGDIGRRFRI